MNWRSNLLEWDRKSGVDEEAFVGIAVFDEVDEETQTENDQVELLRRRHKLRRVQNHVKHRRYEID